VTDIRAARVVEAPEAAVFDHLADLRTHWALAGGRVRLVDESAGGVSHGGRVRMRGPLGLGRDATTEVLRAERPRLLEGRACIGDRTEAEITWKLEPRGDEATLVTLRARVVAAAAWDRALLAVGGRRWLEALFERVLDRLAALAPELAEAQAEGPGEARAALAKSR
jgi:uncharacterized protein YndB with AHSA1/START domain